MIRLKILIKLEIKELILINRFQLLILALLFISSCKNEPPKEATSGIAQITTEVYSKKCSEGSLSITKEITTAVGETPAVLDVDDLPVGAEVSISGTVTNGGVCGFTGSVSFSCKATVRIDTNRTFYCTAENYISGSTSITPGAYSTPGYSSPTVGSRSLISGEFHTYYSGANTFVSLQVSSSSPLVPAPCKLSFICQ